MSLSNSEKLFLTKNALGPVSGIDPSIGRAPSQTYKGNTVQTNLNAAASGATGGRVTGPSPSINAGSPRGLMQNVRSVLPSWLGGQTDTDRWKQRNPAKAQKAYAHLNKGAMTNSQRLFVMKNANALMGYPEGNTGAPSMMPPAAPPPKVPPPSTTPTPGVGVTPPMQPMPSQIGRTPPIQNMPLPVPSPMQPPAGLSPTPATDPYNAPMMSA